MAQLFRQDIQDALPTTVRTRPVDRGRLGVYAAIGASVGTIPIPWLPDAFARRVRGALVHDVAARHGLSLTREARDLLAEPSGPDGPRGLLVQAVRFFGARVALRALTSFGPFAASGRCAARSARTCSATSSTATSTWRAPSGRSVSMWKRRAASGWPSTAPSSARSRSSRRRPRSPSSSTISAKPPPWWSTLSSGSRRGSPRGSCSGSRRRSTSSSAPCLSRCPARGGRARAPRRREDWLADAGGRWPHLDSMRRRSPRARAPRSSSSRAGRSRSGSRSSATIPAQGDGPAAGRGRRRAVAVMRVYERRSRRAGICVAQVLLTHADLADRVRSNNARAALGALLEARAVPILNENDSVAVDEIRFGDNDQLAAMVAPLVERSRRASQRRRRAARRAKAARPASCTTSRARRRPHPQVDERRRHGGMASKVEAARRATLAGAHVVVADARAPETLARGARRRGRRDALRRLGHSPQREEVLDRVHAAAARGIVLDRGAADAVRAQGQERALRRRRRRSRRLSRGRRRAARRRRGTRGRSGPRALRCGRRRDGCGQGARGFPEEFAALAVMVHADELVVGAHP